MREWEVALKMVIYKSIPHLFIIVYLFAIDIFQHWFPMSIKAQNELRTCSILYELQI